DFNIYPKVSVILIAASIILLLIALITDRSDFTTAILIVVALADFLTGIIIIVFAESKGISPLFSSMLYAPLATGKVSLFSELNVFGDAHIIPKALAGSDETLQFNPAGEFKGFEYHNSGFSLGNENTAGIFSKPSSDSLMITLKQDFNLAIPCGEISPDTLSEIFKEILCETTAFCEDVSVNENDGEYIVKLKTYALIKGCRYVRDESPKCCTVSPCPVCSLIGSIIAECFEKVTYISAIWPDYKKEDLIIILKVLSNQPADE
ncbi:MAG: hypothetical protein PHV39_04805, partial [Methanomicrobium sp.]|nr:hypothetical protein [Methanomicrobium sp.]